MKYHIALSRSISLDQMEQAAALGQSPRHVMWALSQRLNATVHAPGQTPRLLSDYVGSMLMGTPDHWALARSLAEQLTGDDLIYCTGEDVGIPIATLCGGLSDPPKVVIMVHEPQRPRSRISLKLFDTAQRSALLITNTQDQLQFMKDYLKLSDDKVAFLLEQTDFQFFTPGPASPDKRGPIVASVGLERRDYRVLAAATADLDVEVKISGFSANVKRTSGSFPDVMPANMSCRFYEWDELVQLYHDADVVVVSLLDSQTTSGITTLLEAMACCRPVIVTGTVGLIDYYQNCDALTVVPLGDVQRLRQAIVEVLSNPLSAELKAKRGYQFGQKHYDSDRYVETLAKQLESLTPQVELPELQPMAAQAA